MKFSSAFQSFVNSGTRPQSDRERSALLDECRAVLSNIVGRIATGEIALAGPQAVTPNLTPAQLDELQKRSLAAKAAREKALDAALAKQRATVKSKPKATTPAPAAPAISNHDKLRREYDKISDPIEKRAFRNRHWSELSSAAKSPTIK